MRIKGGDVEAFCGGGTAAAFSNRYDCGDWSARIPSRDCIVAFAEVSRTNGLWRGDEDGEVVVFKLCAISDSDPVCMEEDKHDGG